MWPTLGREKNVHEVQTQISHPNAPYARCDRVPALGFCADGDSWPVYGQNYANTRYSPLKQINTKNVGQLKLAYSFSLASLRSNESTPLVIGDTMYLTTSWGPKYVYALNAATGERK